MINNNSIVFAENPAMERSRRRVHAAAGITPRVSCTPLFTNFFIQISCIKLFMKKKAARRVTHTRFAAPPPFAAIHRPTVIYIYFIYATHTIYYLLRQASKLSPHFTFECVAMRRPLPAIAPAVNLHSAKMRSACSTCILLNFAKPHRASLRSPYRIKKLSKKEMN